jgi:glycosyltransferase involved in cell wall biosynthesis
LNTCKVSVCIPTYNCEKYISETIESILAQTFSDFELLIIDNCSNDQTPSIIETYAKQEPRIKFLVNEENLGMVGNWNSCLAVAKGEFIKFVFADDLLASPDALDRMVTLLESDKSISLACSSRNLIDESSRFISVESHFETGIMEGTAVINRCIVNQNNFIGEPSTVMFRKEQAGRGFNANYKQIVDLEMWLHLLEQGSFAYINEPLCSFRIHGQQQTAINKETHSHLKDFIFLLDDYLHKDYIELSGFMKKYRRFDTLYGFWKLYKTNVINREAALELINSNSSFSFFIWYPLYKLFKPFHKLFKQRFVQYNLSVSSHSTHLEQD